MLASEVPEASERAAALMDSDPEAAKVLLEEAVAADPFHGPALNNLGVLLLQEGDLQGAADAFQTARECMPRHPDPRLNLGLTLERAGVLEPALVAYQAALEVAPDYLPAVQALVSLQVRLRLVDALTLERIEDVALRSLAPEWTSWAREQLALQGHSR